MKLYFLIKAISIAFIGFALSFFLCMKKEDVLFLIRNNTSYFSVLLNLSVLVYLIVFLKNLTVHITKRRIFNNYIYLYKTIQLVRAIYYTYSVLFGLYCALIAASLVRRDAVFTDLIVILCEAFISGTIVIVSIFILDKGSIKPDDHTAVDAV